MKKISLDNLHGGAVIDMFDEELKKVLRNIADENTPAMETRSITIKLVIKPDKTRRTGAIKIDVGSKLSNVKPTEGLLFFDENDGDQEAFEDDYQQQELGLENKNIYTMPKKIEGVN